MRRIELDRWARYFKFRNDGSSTEQAAKKARISSAAAYRFESGDPSSSGVEAATVLGVEVVGGNLVEKPYSKEATEALEDFAYFRLRYFGRKSTPWQERSAYEVLRLHQSPDREYVVQNEPPGSGKSTLFTHDIPAWMIARDRSIRIMLGSETGRQSRMYAGRLRRTLERDNPLRADVDKIAAGITFDAVATMAEEFGPFKPDARSDVWSAHQFTVRQHGGVSVDDKEPTISAWGRDEKFLGGRYDVVVWDDVVSKKPSAEMWDIIVEWWLTQAETRLEPGGLLILQGQRMWADDIYRFCLDMRTDADEPKYSHQVYQAHDDDKCAPANHAPDAPPWPDGCLLDPHRLPWKFLSNVKRTSSRLFEVQYQQNDGAGEESLVDPLWLTGGQSTSGAIFPGCYDTNRVMGQFDPDDAEGWSVVTVDPSPTKWWGIQWWLARPELHRYVMVTKHRTPLGSPDFLSLNLDTGEWSGLLHQMYQDSVAAGAPITHVIVEFNAAQKWLITQPHVQKFASAFGITFIAHQTHSNKNDPKFGVQSISDYFRQGKIRLPFGDAMTREEMKSYTHELTRWPQAATEDEVMATWFFILALTNHYTPRNIHTPTQPRPGWYGSYHQRGLVENRPPRQTPADRLSRAK